MLKVTFLMCLSWTGRRDTAAQTNFYDRIVTNVEDVKRGVPVDYRYNESSNNLAGLSGRISVPGCPKSEAGLPWVHFQSGNSTKCYLVGTQGPCLPTHVLFMEEGSLLGICNCECFTRLGRHQGGGFQDKNVTLEWWHPDIFCGEDANFRVYSRRHKRCFEPYTQGPCNSTEWLVPNHPLKSRKAEFWSGSVSCENRKCPDGQVPKSEDTSLSDANSGSLCVKNSVLNETLSSRSPASVSSSQCAVQGGRWSGMLSRCVGMGVFVM